MAGIFTAEEAVSEGGLWSIFVGRVPNGAERREKPDNELSTFSVRRSRTPEADLRPFGTASGGLPPMSLLPTKFFVGAALCRSALAHPVPQIPLATGETKLIGVGQ